MALAGFDYMGFIGPRIADEKNPHSKAEVIKMLTASRDLFGNWLEGLTDDFLGQAIGMPPYPNNPPSKTRFEMLLGTKEHEMHHRGQLMIMERMLGIVPHLTRRMQEMMAQQTQAQAQPARPKKRFTSPSRPDLPRQPRRPPPLVETPPRRSVW